MKTKKYLILAGILAVSCGVLWASQQLTGETDLSAKDKNTRSNLTARQKLGLSTKRVWANKKEVLQGLEGVLVVVEFIKPEAEKYGLTKKDLQTDTESQLRQYGIKVLTFVEGLSTPGAPWLYINVNVAMSKEERVAAAAIGVELREDVLLVREPKRICYGASSWTRGMVGVVGLSGIKDIREKVKDFVSEFINDYYAANPTKNPPVCLPPTKATQTEPPGKNGMTALYFTQGSHKDDVLRIQGTPDAIHRYPALGEEVWRYGLSTVEFSMRDDRVAQWSNYGNLKVKLEPRKNVIAPTASPSTTKAPQKGLISAIAYSEDSPCAVINDRMVYEGDTIDGVTIAKIYKDRVVFEKEGREVTLSWTQKIGEAPKAHWYID
ncbi:MAG: hypothetical protein KAY65_06925 [Planctomycetes bacterium]|nr:hypothetical protein [Planctomycetota bacterium]